MRSGKKVSFWEGGGSGTEKLLVGSGRSSKLLGDILQPHVEIIVKVCTYVQSEM